MLQSNRNLALTENGRIEADAIQRHIPVIQIAKRQLPLILFVFLLICSLGAVYLFSAARSFTAYTTMIIDSRKLQLFQQQSLLADLPADTATVDSQVEVLKSENIALSVIKDLKLTEDPEFIGDGGIVAAIAAPLLQFFGSTAEPISETELTRIAVRGFADRLTIKRIALTYAIQIGFRARDPNRAAEIANAVADAYVTDQLEAKYQATRRAGSWLQDRIRELRQQASTAEGAVVDFKARNNIVATGGRLLNEQQLGELNSQLILARAQTAEAKARLERVEEIVRAEIPDATVTDTLRNEVITRLRQQYLDLQNREADWSNRYGKNHLAAIHLRNQMREIRKSILDELRRIAETYKSESEIARAREESVQKGLAEVVTESQTTNQAQIALRELEGTALTYRALHDNFLQRYMESVQQQSFPITESRIISSASPPLKPSHPRSLIVLAGTLLAGVLFGAGAGFARETLSGTFKSPDDVERILGLQCLAEVPQIKDIALTRPHQNGSASDRILPTGMGRLPQVILAPFSAFAEAIRGVKVAFDVERSTKQIQAIGITSCYQAEGKSTIASNLAYVFAASGLRVLLIDADMRNPSLSRELTPETRSGILEVLTGTSSLQDAIWSDTKTKLSFLPTVITSPLAQTADILGSDGLKDVLQTLRNTYDYVIFDLPPLGPVVDVRATINLVDCFVCVIDSRKTTVRRVQRTLRTADAVRERIFGVVLNKVQPARMGGYNGYSAYYGNP